MSEATGLFKSVADNAQAIIDAKDEVIAQLKTQINALKRNIGDMNVGRNVTVTFEAETPLDVRTMMGYNGTVKVMSDMETTNVYASGTFANNIVTLNLNGKHVTCTRKAPFDFGIMARGSCEVTVQGSGTMECPIGESPVLWAAGGTINVKAGTFVTTHTEVAYAEKGVLNISGGTFKTSAEDKRYVLNVKDSAAADGTASIVVTGGKFYDFDPTNATSDPNPPINYCAEGYGITKTETVVEDGVEHTVYTVGKGGVVNSAVQTEPQTEP